MDFKIEKGTLLSGLYLAQGIADRKSTMPILANVLAFAGDEGLDHVWFLIPLPSGVRHLAMAPDDPRLPGRQVVVEVLVVLAVIGLRHQQLDVLADDLRGDAAMLQPHDPAHFERVLTLRRQQPWSWQRASA